jgi:hypothetical protein
MYFEQAWAEALASSKLMVASNLAVRFDSVMLNQRTTGKRS